jgi:ketosteroid isomerase-like protein
VEEARRDAGVSENLALVQRFVEAFNRGDVDWMAERTTPDVQLDEWPTAPGAQSYRGREGVREAMSSWFEVWEWMKVEVVDVVEVDDRVLVTLDQRAKGKGSEIEVEIRSFNVYTVRDGKVSRLQLFTEREPALGVAELTANNEEEEER